MIVDTQTRRHDIHAVRTRHTLPPTKAGPTRYPRCPQPPHVAPHESGADTISTLSVPAIRCIPRKRGRHDIHAVRTRQTLLPTIAGPTRYPRCPHPRQLTSPTLAGAYGIRPVGEGPPGVGRRWGGARRSRAGAQSFARDVISAESESSSESRRRARALGGHPPIARDPLAAAPHPPTHVASPASPVEAPTEASEPRVLHRSAHRASRAPRLPPKHPPRQPSPASSIEAPTEPAEPRVPPGTISRGSPDRSRTGTARRCAASARTPR